MKNITKQFALINFLFGFVIIYFYTSLVLASDNLSEHEGQPEISTSAASEESINTSEDDENAVHFRDFLDAKKLYLRSTVALIMDERNGVMLYGKEINKQMPIASLTKLMTAMVTLDAGLPMDEPIKITRQDRDRLRNSRSRLRYGTTLSREDLLHLALAASENRAASALARTYPGGKKAFLQSMNHKANQLGMNKTFFKDATGLNSANVSTAQDLAKMVNAAYKYPKIREMTTVASDSVVDIRSGREISFRNTNKLVNKKQWNIELSKTGYIAESGYCLVMMAEIVERPLIIVLLNSWGKYSKFGDANRIRKWLYETERKFQRINRNLVSSQS